MSFVYDPKRCILPYVFKRCDNVEPAYRHDTSYPGYQFYSESSLISTLKNAHRMSFFSFFVNVIDTGQFKICVGALEFVIRDSFLILSVYTVCGQQWLQLAASWLSYESYR